jgi:antitoxin CptB
VSLKNEVKKSLGPLRKLNNNLHMRIATYRRNKSLIYLIVYTYYIEPFSAAKTSGHTATMTNINELIKSRRKRLKFRSWHRGTREMDLLLGRFADQYLDGYTADDLNIYEGILEISDPDLYNWVSGREGIPDTAGRNIICDLKKFTLSL